TAATSYTPSASTSTTTDGSQAAGRAAAPCESSVLGAGDRELKRRGWGCLLPCCLAACRPTRCAPRCGTRALDRRLPVLDEAAVGEFGLGGELLVEPVLLLRDPDADPLAFLAFGAGRELELADLLAGERRAGEGVVLTVAEHVPGDHGELAGDRDGRDVAAA